MIVQSFLELAGIEKYTVAAFHLELTTQSIYNYIKDPSAMKIGTLEKMANYLKSQSIKFTITFNKDNQLIFKGIK